MPGFNIDSTGRGPSPTVESVRAHRWSVEIPTLVGQDILQFHAREVGRPESESDKITMHHGMNEIYIPGKYRWSPIDIKFYDAVVGTSKVSTILHYWWSKIMQDVDASRLNIDGISSASDAGNPNITINDNSQGDFKRSIYIRLLDGSGRPMLEYNLYGAWPQKIAPSSMDYTNSDISTVSVTISYDAAKIVDYGNTTERIGRISDTLTTTGGNLGFASQTTGGNIA